MRFDRSSVIVSDIAAQFYDELQLEASYLQGRTETQAMQIGREGHQGILEERSRVSSKEVWRKIYFLEKYFVSEMSLIAKYKNIPIYARMDLIAFLNSVPALLFEFKFSQYTQDYISYHVQLLVEGLILKRLGFDTSTLMYVIVIIPPIMKNNSRQIFEIAKIIFQKYLDDRRTFLYEGVNDLFSDITVKVGAFHLEQAQEYLDWALAYWKFEREASNS